MKKAIGIVTLSMLVATLPGLAAEKPSDKPDPEMLRMMEVLKDWEMFKNMEMLKEMQRVNRDTNPSGATVQNSLPPKQKETVR